jgi:hypothetical protein
MKTKFLETKNGVVEIATLEQAVELISREVTIQNIADLIHAFNTAGMTDMYLGHSTFIAIKNTGNPEFKFFTKKPKPTYMPVDLFKKMNEKIEEWKEAHKKFSNIKIHRDFDEKKVRIYYDIFFDRIAGNGWMYGTSECIEILI